MIRRCVSISWITIDGHFKFVPIACCVASEDFGFKIRSELINFKEEKFENEDDKFLKKRWLSGLEYSFVSFSFAREINQVN